MTLALLSILLATVAYAGERQASFREAGRFYIQNFDTHELKMNPQNWAVLQDTLGLIYVGNTQGLYEYDGVSWRQIKLARNKVVRALHLDSHSRVLVGSRDEFGFLAPDSTGLQAYHSLMEYVAPEDSLFDDIKEVCETSRGAYFQASKRLFRWRGEDEIKTWSQEHGFKSAYAIRDTLYVHVKNVGLMWMDPADSLRLVPGGERFAEMFITMMLPDRPQGILIGTHHEGILRYEGGSYTPLPAAVNDWLAEKQLYYGVRLSNGMLALGTIRGGVLILGADFEQVRIEDESTGLIDEMVLGVFVDRQDGLWIACDDGLARLEMPSPISYFDESSGIKGSVEGIARHRGRLYLACSLGVYAAVETDGPMRFEAVSGIETQCWTLLDTDEGLLAGSNEGVFLIAGSEAELILPDFKITHLSRSRRDPNWVLVGHRSGLTFLRLRDGRWTAGGEASGFEARVSQVHEDWDGAVLIALEDQGAMRLEFADGFESPHTASEEYGEKQGATPNWSMALLDFDGRVGLGGQYGMYRCASDSERVALGVSLLPDTTFGAVFADSSRDVFRLAQDSRGNAWIYAGPEIGIARRQADGSHVWDPDPLSRVPNISTFVLYAEDDGVLWSGNFDGLLRYDPAVARSEVEDYRSIVRRVSTIGADSLIFGGVQAADAPRPLLPFENNALRFQFAALSYDEVSRNKYQYFLEGFDKDWSDWTDETQKDYTNLPGGDYVFRVRARNVYGHESAESSFAFAIKVPWYLSWWAYSLVAIAALAAIYGLGTGLNRLRLRSLEARVRQRTAQIAQVVGDLEISRNEAESARLEAEAATRAKSEFLAIMSHEIRTPLNGIIGMAQVVLDSNPRPEHKESIEIIHSSGESLLTIINDILVFSKIEAGQMELEVHLFEIRECFEDVLDLFGGKAREKGLEICCLFHPAVPRWVRGDPMRLRQILGNLLSNAIKFTETGEITLTVDVRSLPGELFELHTAVSDTGIGIAPHGMRRLFKSFSQVDSSTSRKYGGTGLGLAICRRLCELMDGRIWVESEEGVGSTFHFTARILRERQRAGEGDAHPDLAELRLLIIDDSDASRAVLRTQTRSWGMKPVEAASAEDALALLPGDERFDLILIDQGPGERDGVELARRIAGQLAGSYPPLILLKTVNDYIKADGTPLSAVLSKPVRARNLQATILETLREKPGEKPGQPDITLLPAEEMESLPLRILLAEDNSINQKVALSLLKRLGYDAEVVVNGSEALQRVKEESYDLVLMDIQMPEMDGIEATKRIRKELPGERQPRIIAMTADAMPGDRKRCLDAGMDDYISKPLQMEVMAQTLARCQRISLG